MGPRISPRTAASRSAVLRVLGERKEGVSFADYKRGLVNTRQMKVSAEALRKWVTPEAAKQITEAGGHFAASFKVEEATIPPEREGDKPKLATVVSVEILFIAESPAYVQTGGGALRSNGTLEREYLDAIGRVLGH